MLNEFFQLLPIPKDQLLGTYDLRLTALSFFVATFASYIALDLTGRLRDFDNTKTSRLLWLLGGAIAMGSGIWSMHFIGMLSFTIPGLSLRYDLLWTILSLGVAIIASGFALFLLQAPRIRFWHYLAGGIILGLAIASMHYTGMEAMLITLNIRYLPALFFLSILIAIIASEAALWLALKSTQVVSRIRTRIKLVSAVIMGVAICGMHYTGMAASIFTPLCSLSDASGTDALDPTLLSIGIAAITFVILGIALFASAYKESLNQQQLEKARQLGMAEISSSILHNVGNVLNSVCVGINTVTEKNESSKLVGLEKLNRLLNENKNDLVSFLTKDPRGTKILPFIDELAKYWHDEQLSIAAELLNLNKNVEFIKEIITTQQSLTKGIDFEQVISIDELLNEALLITGLDLKKNISIEKNYTKINPLLIEKIKLLQVLVNLLRNAGDAVMESSKPNKKITIKTSLIDKKVIIEITDNGIGVLPKNINKIFNFGFTTKKTGHGFGIHTSAIAMRTLGGSMKVSSEGFEKGTTFTIEFPYNKPGF